MGRNVVRVWVLFLTVVGLSICYYKFAVLGLPLKPQQDTEVWTVQAKISFLGDGGPAIMELYLPNIIPGYLKLDEDFISGGFGFSVSEEGDNRKAQWAIRRARDLKNLYYRIAVARSDHQVMWQSHPAFPKAPDYPEPYASAIRSVLDEARTSSADIATYTAEILQQLNSQTPNENVKLLRNKAGSAEQWVKELINVLQGVRIPARILWGLTTSDASSYSQLEPLLQVHNGQKWLTFDPLTSERGIPANFFSWQVGSKPLFHLTGGEQVEVTFSVVKSYKEQIEVARSGAKYASSIFTDYSLLSLPVQSQSIYRLLLMVPIGALIVVFMRTLVGISTFGTFMPVLIALAFRETQLFWGVLLFSLIVAIGLMIRFYLERLMLLLIPRLASILIIVVILMLLISLVSHQLEADRLLSVALFPMVIMAMTIERMSITWEENGARDAILQGFGSLLVAILGYLAMTNEQLMYVMFVFPELLLVLLAASLWMGRYNGYRLFELYRFREMKKIER
ncbi:MAG: inactive transglutaminase family protein [Pseudomonadales bacterium]|nr:inactive transglutaminase family protein [Pseudomonadales bacterium]